MVFANRHEKKPDSTQPTLEHPSVLGCDPNASRYPKIKIFGNVGKTRVLLVKYEVFAVGDVSPNQDLDTWVIKAAPLAVAYARSLLRDAHQAEDIVQDCFCRLLAKSAVYDLPTDGMKLLYRSISNACINHTTRRRTMYSLTRMAAESGEEHQDDPVDRQAWSPEVVLEHRELAERVQEGLQELGELPRAALELKSLGYSQLEIAEILEITSSHAGVLVHRARQALAQYLAPYWSGERSS